jgi:hypothetical protein
MFILFPDGKEHEVIKMSEALKTMGKDGATFKVYVCSGRIPSVKVGGGRYIEEKYIKKFIERQPKKPKVKSLPEKPIIFFGYD